MIFYHLSPFLCPFLSSSYTTSLLLPLPLPPVPPPPSSSLCPPLILAFTFTLSLLVIPNGFSFTVVKIYNQILKHLLHQGTIEAFGYQFPNKFFPVSSDAVCNFTWFSRLEAFPVSSASWHI